MQNASMFDSFLSCPPSFMDIGSSYSYNAVSLVIALLAVPTGVLLATCGSRLSRVTFFLCGFISGMLVTFAIIRDQIDSMQLPLEGAIGVAAAGGLMVGLLSLGVQILGLFVVGMNASFLLAAATIGVVGHFLTYDDRWQRAATVSNGNTSFMFSSPFPSRWLPIGCLLGACLLGGLLSLLKPRYLLIIGSSLIGSAIIVLTFGYFLETKNPLRPVRFVVAAIIGTRYMDSHYGRYLFRYIPVALPLHALSESSVDDVTEERISVNSFTLNALFNNNGEPSSTTLPSPLSEKEEVPKVPTFLCWSDFVLLVCWLLIASLCAIIQVACSLSGRHHHRRSSRRKCGKPRRSSVHKIKTVSLDKIASRRATNREPGRGSSQVEQSSRGDLPPYSHAAEASAVRANAEAWLSRNNLDEASHSAPSVRQSSGFISLSTTSSQNGESTAMRWMSPSGVVGTSALLTTSSSSKPLQSSPVTGAGHLLRMRRSLGDVLSQDFRQHFIDTASIAPRPLPTLDEPGSSQC